MSSEQDTHDEPQPTLGEVVEALVLVRASRSDEARVRMATVRAEDALQRLVGGECGSDAIREAEAFISESIAREWSSTGACSVAVGSRREAQLRAVERVVQTTLGESPTADGYWRQVAEDMLEAAERALFEPQAVIA